MFFILYGHEKLDLKDCSWQGRKVDWKRQGLSKKVYTSKAEIAEENSRTTSFGENGLFSCGHVCFGKQLLPQMNICCRKAMKNNKITSPMGQPLLDVCST